jgi:hypothetical protein
MCGTKPPFQQGLPEMTARYDSMGINYARLRQPEAYLDASIRSGSSSFRVIGNLEAGLQKLRQDIETGEWERRHGDLLRQDAYDAGYRLVTAD